MNNTPFVTSTNSAAGIAGKGWRLQLLNKILLGAFALSSLAIIYTCIKAINAGRYSLLAIYLGVYLMLALATFLKPNEYIVRAGLLAALFYSVGVIELTQAGVWSNGPLFLFGFVLVTATLFNFYVGISAIVLAVVTTAIFGWLAVSQNYQFPLAGDYANAAIATWIRILMVLTIFSGMVTVAVRQLVQHNINYYRQADQEKARLLQEAREAQRLSDMLRETVAALVGSRNEDKVLQGILDYLGKVVPYDSASIMLVEPSSNTLRIKAGRGIAANSPAWDIDFPIGDDGKNYDIVYNKMPVIMPDVRKDPRWTKIEGDSYINSWMGIPLIQDDIVRGVLTLDHHLEGYYTPDHLAMAQSFAQHAAIALENARLFSVVNQRVNQLEAIRQATLTLTSSLKLQEVLEKILEIIFHFTPQASKVNIFLYQHRYLTFGASFFEGGLTHKPHVNARENGLAYAVAQQADLILMPGIHETGEFKAVNGYNFEIDNEDTLAGLPLKIGQNVVGVMTVSSKRSGDWSIDELDLLKLLADQAAIAIENARLYNDSQKYAADLEDVVTERTVELKTLYLLAQALSRANRFEDAIRLVINHLEKVIPFDAAACLLQAENTPHFYLSSPFKLKDEQQHKILRELQWVAGLAPGQLPADTPPTTTHLQTVSGDTLPPIKFMANAAIIAGHKRLGALIIVSHTASFTAEHSRLLHTMADQVAETIGRLQLLVAAEHQRLENLIACLPNGVLLLNLEQRIVLANPVAKDLMPALTPAGIGDKLTSLGGHPLTDILTQADSDTPFSLFSHHKDGLQFEIDVNLVTAGPETGGWILVIRDVTEREYLQKQVQQQERMAAVGELAAGIAHDFNNILTSIIGFAELILLEESLPPQIQEDVERITSQGHRAAHLVRQILDFSRQTISEKKPLDLAPLLQETVKLLKRTLPEDIHIDFTPPPEGVFTAQIDYNQIQQVLTNLAVNARDAMPNGGQLTFEISSQTVSLEFDPVGAAPMPPRPNRWIVVKISDTGLGIPPETQSKIFEPFFTTKEVGKGTGLGLAQVYGIMRQHQGHIRVNSLPGQGTTFSLYFPIMPEAKDRLATNLATASIPKGQHELILLVEDDAAVLEIGASLLEHLNYRVISARNGVKALELFEKHFDDISLVLTDLTMPKMGGAELTQSILQKAPNVKIIAMTGYPRFQADKDLVSNNIVGWLQKPLSLEKLAVTLHRTLMGKNEE